MAFPRTLRHPATLRQITRITNIRPLSTTPHYFATDTQATAADGASDKTPQNAEPKILNRSPPSGKEQPGEVQEHNKNINQRAKKPAGKATEEDAKNDKVSKDFWKGE